MDMYTIYKICVNWFANFNAEWLIVGSLIVVGVAMLAQFVRYFAVFRCGRIHAKTKRFIRKNGEINQYNFAKYLKKIKGALSNKEKNFLNASRPFEGNFSSSYARERINNVLKGDRRKSNLFQIVAIVYIFVLHAILVCLRLEWVALYMIVVLAAVALFIMAKIFSLIRRLWAYFDGKKAAKIDELLCLNVTATEIKQAACLLSGQEKNIFQPGRKKKTNTMDSLQREVSEFLKNSPDTEIAKIVGENLKDVRQTNYLNSDEEERFKSIEDGLSNYCR